MEEFWKPVVGFENSYEVSNYGRVRSVTRQVSSKNNSVKTIQGKILKLKTTQAGYNTIALSKGHRKNRVYVFVHKIEMVAFMPNPDSYPIINHKDENKQNNFIWVNIDGSVDPEKSNLEWCSIQYNNTYGDRIAKAKFTFYKNHSKNFKKVKQFTKEHRFVKEHNSAKQAAEAIGVNVSLIRNVCAKRYGYVSAGGYLWEYSN